MNVPWLAPQVVSVLPGTDTKRQISDLNPELPGVWLAGQPVIWDFWPWSAEAQKHSILWNPQPQAKEMPAIGTFVGVGVGSPGSCPKEKGYVRITISKSPDWLSQTEYLKCIRVSLCPENIHRVCGNGSWEVFRNTRGLSHDYNSWVKCIMVWAPPQRRAMVSSGVWWGVNDCAPNPMLSIFLFAFFASYHLGLCKNDSCL